MESPRRTPAWPLLSGLLILGLTPAMAVEEARYELVATYDEFELRRYAPMVVAEVEVRGDFERAGGRAFPVLADYIGGNNAPAEKIAMTAPVNQQAAGQRIAMTAPVSQTATDGSDRYVVSFVMPAGYTLENLPRPLDARVELREVPAGLLAARRYSGRWTERAYRNHEASLLAALAESDLEVTGPPVYARYNAPFVPWFLRRNEVLVPVRHRGP